MVKVTVKNGNNPVQGNSVAATEFEFDARLLAGHLRRVVLLSTQSHHEQTTSKLSRRRMEKGRKRSWVGWVWLGWCVVCKEVEKREGG